MLEVAETTVGQANGRRGEILRGKGIYGGKWDLQLKDDEIARLNTQLQQSRAEANNLRQNSGRSRGGGETSGYGSTKGASRGQGSRGKGRGGAVPNNNPGGYARGSDPAFETKRALLCLKFNRGACSDPSSCNLSHTCNRRVGPGTPCGHGHSSKDHQ